MAVESELAKAGILDSPTETFIAKDVRASGDLVVEEDLTIGDDATVGGDLIVGGAVNAKIGGIYYLRGTLVVSGTTADYIPIPTGGTGNIVKFRAVTTVALTIADSVITLNTGTGAGDDLADTITLAFSGSAIGDIHEEAISQTGLYHGVLEDERVKVVSDGGSTAGAIHYVIEIERT